MHALGNRVWGFTPELFDESQDADRPAPAPEAQDAMVREVARRYPHLLTIATAATGGDPSRGGGCDEQFEFEFALDLLLEGFDRLHREGWSSRR